jgi:hypothetical protein
MDDKGRKKFKSVLHVERMLLPQGPPPYMFLRLRNWGKQPHSLAFKHNKSLGKKFFHYIKSLLI